MRLRRPAPLLLVLALAGVAAVAVTASAVSRGGLGAAADGPRIARVAVRAVERPFVNEDSAGVAAAGAVAVPQILDREVTIDGSGFFGTSFGPFVRFVAPDGTSIDATMVVLESGGRIVAWPPAGLRGAQQLVVENPDGRRASATVGL